MIIEAKLTKQPRSGEFKERVYDKENSWNFENWTWIKFLEDNGDEWIGNFRGTGNDVAISTVKEEVIVLTSNYIFRININTGDLIEIKDNHQYISITFAPKGEIILADYYKIFKTDGSLEDIKLIDSPFDMDMVKFKNWKNDKLQFTCDEFLNKNRRNLLMELDSSSWEIK